MIIACPACATRYTVPDGSIGADGRVVRCAKCRHSWFQDGVQTAPMAQQMPAAPADPLPAAEPVRGRDAAPPPVAEQADAAAGADDRADVMPPAPASRFALPPDSREYAEMPSAFAHEPPFRPRRRRAAAWLIAAAVLALLALAAIAALGAYRVPDWLPQPRWTLGESGGAPAAPDLVLSFPPDRQERRPLPNGGDFFDVGGSIRNAGQAVRKVPMLLIVLRDGHGNIVYSLQAAPPKPSLAPGESETIDQAIIGAPATARTAEIGWKP